MIRPFRGDFFSVWIRLSFEQDKLRDKIKLRFHKRKFEFITIVSGDKFLNLDVRFLGNVTSLYIETIFWTVECKNTSWSWTCLQLTQRIPPPHSHELRCFVSRETPLWKIWRPKTTSTSSGFIFEFLWTLPTFRWDVERSLLESIHLLSHYMIILHVDTIYMTHNREHVSIISWHAC